jgi:DNA-binding NarL/FixJ family response regulator
MTNPATIRILIADDHPSMREGLAALLGLQPDFQVVALAKDGLETIALYHQHQPDVLLLDLSMPGMEGSGLNLPVRASLSSLLMMVMKTFIALLELELVATCSKTFPARNCLMGFAK